MPEYAPTSSDALRGPFREFVRNPHHDGLFVHCAADGVDLVVQIVGETEAVYAGDCDACGHRSRFDKVPAKGTAKCAFCRDPLPRVAPARPGEKHYAFAWRVAWAKDGFTGLGMGTTIEKGRFMDARLLDGIADVHGVLRVYLPLFEALNLVTMADYRAYTRLHAGAREAAPTVRHREGS